MDDYSELLPSLPIRDTIPSFLLLDNILPIFLNIPLALVLSLTGIIESF